MPSFRITPAFEAARCSETATSPCFRPADRQARCGSGDSSRLKGRVAPGRTVWRSTIFLLHIACPCCQALDCKKKRPCGLLPHGLFSKKAVGPFPVCPRLFRLCITSRSANARQTGVSVKIAIIKAKVGGPEACQAVYKHLLAKPCVKSFMKGIPHSQSCQ